MELDFKEISYLVFVNLSHLQTLNNCKKTSIFKFQKWLKLLWNRGKGGFFIFGDSSQLLWNFFPFFLVASLSDTPWYYVTFLHSNRQKVLTKPEPAGRLSFLNNVRPKSFVHLWRNPELLLQHFSFYCWITSQVLPRPTNQQASYYY